MRHKSPDPVANDRLTYLMLGRLDYDGANKILIISCPDQAHEYMSGFDKEFVEVINGNNMDFYGDGDKYKDDLHYRITSRKSTG